MSAEEEEAEFASLFSASAKFASKTGTERRVKAERRAAMTDKQRTKGGSQGRTIQMNFRCTPAFKRLAAGLCGHMAAQSGNDVSTADMLEEAVKLLAKQKGYKGAPDAAP
ncbi:MAG: hypothetical protein JSR89_18190 [Proteobacteria bacterium]|nr:hypothetical protein [Pseudomonadota bacterium]